MQHASTTLTIEIAGWGVQLQFDDAALADQVARRYAGHLISQRGNLLARVRLASDWSYWSDDELEQGDVGPEVQRTPQGYQMRWRGLRLACAPDFSVAEGLIRPDPLAVENVLRLLYAALAPRHGGLLLHASAVARGERAYVLFGKSGAGKSTSYMLAPYNARISDECVALRRTRDGWVVASTPLAEGALPERRSYALAGLYRLHKAQQHALISVPPGELAQSLLGCVLFHDDDPAVQQLIFAAVLDLLASAPAGALAFAKDVGYLEVLDEPLSPWLRIERHPHTASRTIGGEAIVLTPATTTFHLLNGSGSELWSYLEQPRTLQELADYLCSEFEIDGDTAVADAQTFVQSLAAQNLVLLAPEAL